MLHSLERRTSSRMKTVIFKYILSSDHATLDLPVGSKPLSVGVQKQGELVVWVLQPCDPIKCERWTITSINTGSNFYINDLAGYEDGLFLGTVSVQTSTSVPIVWHIFANRKAN